MPRDIFIPSIVQAERECLNWFSSCSTLASLILGLGNAPRRKFPFWPFSMKNGGFDLDLNHYWNFRRPIFFVVKYTGNKYLQLDNFGFQHVPDLDPFFPFFSEKLFHFSTFLL